MRSFLLAAVTVAVAVCLIAPCRAQVVHGQAEPPAHRAVIIPPLPRPVPSRGVELHAVAATIDIDGQLATTHLELSLHNPTSQPQEAEVLLPVPAGVTVRSLQYDGTGTEPTAKLLPRDEARRIYNDIVGRLRDPALLEFAGYNLIRTSAFPVPAGATQKLRIAYEELLPADTGRVDYALPRSESLESSGVAWTITATIKSAHPIATVYSPSHDIVTERPAPDLARITLTGAAAAVPGAFRIAYLPQPDEHGPAFTVLAYPDPESAEGGGYFLLLAAVGDGGGAARTMKREVTIVIDRSGSMRGPKMEQARAAALQVLEGLDEGEFFNIIDYSDSVAAYAEKPVAKSAETMAQARAYLRALRAEGGTNIHDALLEALRPAAADGALPMILFLTDGLPTVGEKSEVAIRDAVNKANAHGRRIFTFGVGFDVNAPLLSTIARTSRAATTFVLPDEDVEMKVSQVFRRLNGPVLASPRLAAVGPDGKAATRAVRDLQPAALMDVFQGDQVVVLGRYTGSDTITLRLIGMPAGGGEERSFDFAFDPAAATHRHGYVPRLWATRTIGALLEEIRALGATGVTAASDPRFKELVDEVVRLSTKFGVLTEYTAFLAVEPGAVRPGEPVALVPAERAAEEARDQVETRALHLRAGAEGVAQTMNIQGQNELVRNQVQACWYDGNMNEVRPTGVQQANDMVAFCRGTRWVDARILHAETEPPQRTVEFGTPEFFDVVDRLASEGRQALLARGGEVYVLVGNERTLVRCP